MSNFVTIFNYYLRHNMGGTLINGLDTGERVGQSICEWEEHIIINGHW